MKCCGCGLESPENDGPTHAYMLSSPGCWAAFGRLLAREYESTEYRVLHRLTVDAYAVQHPGIDTPQSRNSVGIHLSRLALILERGWRIERANRAMLVITAKKMHYPWLAPPPSLGVLTVRDVLRAQTAGEHLRAVEMWARSVWQAWEPHRTTVRGWLERPPD